MGACKKSLDDYGLVTFSQLSPAYFKYCCEKKEEEDEFVCFASEWKAGYKLYNIYFKMGNGAVGYYIFRISYLMDFVGSDVLHDQGVVFLFVCGPPWCLRVEITCWKGSDMFCVWKCYCSGGQWNITKNSVHSQRLHASPRQSFYTVSIINIWDCNWLTTYEKQGASYIV